MNIHKLTGIMKKRLSGKQVPIMTACVLLICTAIPIAASHFYQPVIAEPEPAESLMMETAGETETWTTQAVVETVEAEEEYVPAPGNLNLAHYFPEGADRSKMTESMAGLAFKTLMSHDEAWISKIYDMADASPLQMASALGKSRQQVTGGYNEKDEKHDPAKPETWTINSFKKVRMTFLNGDGQAVSAYSNVIDIMSMANLYTYFKGVEDYDLFLSYSKKLWEDSHSYRTGISDIYYCDGCLSEDAERKELEELEAEAIAEEASGYTKTSETGEVSTGAETVSVSQQTTEVPTASAVIEAGLTHVKEETTVASTQAVASETIPESTAGVIVAGAPAATMAPETMALESVASAETAAEETLPVTAAELPSGIATPADLTIAETTEPAEVLKTAVKCPGHVDLIVQVSVIGLKEENGLFAKDTIGNDRSNIEENGWPGWNNYTKASARLLSSQDWFDKYGLSLSVISMRNPLTDSEIESYMNQLPLDLSQTRKDLIQFALSSVGKVPYYWGGKPSSTGYSGNSFGILTAPDVKGRVLKGLDCSGWINWVYWSVTGQRLTYESTSGLAISGQKINRSELKPGDIIVRTGTDAHVIMFLGWTADGKIRCIHESSAGVNNVTVAIRDAYWPYYRKLVD